MGLDCMFFKVPRHHIPKVSDENTVEYFRKNWALHSWMRDLCAKRNEISKEFSDQEVYDFNGVFLKLTGKDFENLMMDLLHGELDWNQSLFSSRAEFEAAMAEAIVKLHRISRIYDVYYEGDY